MDAALTAVSKFLSYVLRHAPERIGLSLDPEGWASVAQLLTLSEQACPALSLGALQRVVALNDKKRFELSLDGQRIRAVQGHSSAWVRRQYTPKVPPVLLYHGTVARHLGSIMRQGLTPQGRHHVHLSSTIDTAEAVGARHGTPVILRVDSKAMYAAGAKFFQAENGVWLSDHVPAQYIERA